MADESRSTKLKQRLLGFFHRGKERVGVRAARMKDRVVGVAPADVQRRLEAIDVSAVREQMQRINPGFLRGGASDVADSDIDRVVRESDAIASRFNREGPLGRLLDDGQLLLQLVRDAWDGTYRQLPRWTLSATVFALLYVLNPLDLIPDALPGIGVMDDAALVSLCLVLIEQDLLTYRAWRYGALPPGTGGADGSEGEMSGRESGGTL